MLRRGGGSRTGLVLLLLQLFQFGIHRIPPVTLALIALMSGIHLIVQPSIPWHSICIGVESVWYYKDLSRLLKGAFFHADDWHLYYNMLSLMYKGQYIEHRVGSGWLLYMVAVFTAASNVLLLYVNYAAAYLLYDMAYLRQCALGFSGVIFALKVVATHLTPPHTQHILGFIPIHSTSVCWAELFLIQLLVPNASFTGHLAGIIVGLAYTKGGLKTLMEVFAAPFRFLRTAGRRGQSYTYATGTARSHSYNSSRYTGGLSEEEQMRRAMEQSLEDHTHNEDSLYHSTSTVEPTAPMFGQINRDDSSADTLEEIRRRRLARFNQ